MNARQPKLKKVPVFKTDEEAEDFVDNADLTEYDFSDFKRFRFEFQKKEARVNMRLPASLLEAVKMQAQERGIPYQRLIREAIEHAVEPARKRAS
jgi:predicted DNA binding CopG/RHH family protein